MKSYKQPTWPTTKLIINNTKEGEHLETKLERAQNNKEKVDTDMQAPIIHTERKDGVQAAYNIRTDRFDVALAATTAVEKSYTNKRRERHKPKDQGQQNDPGPTEPTEGKK